MTELQISDSNIAKWGLENDIANAQEIIRVIHKLIPDSWSRVQKLEEPDTSPFILSMFVVIGLSFPPWEYSSCM